MELEREDQEAPERVPERIRLDGRGSRPRGEKIEGGVSRRVTVGDVIVIPGRTPHWWSSLEGDIRYMIVRADPVGTMTLK